MKGMTTCKICGRDFPLMAEEHYVAVDTKCGGIKAVLEGDGTTLYDVFDCPHCGCQNVMQVRKVDLSECCECSCEEGGEEDE